MICVVLSWTKSSWDSNNLENSERPGQKWNRLFTVKVHHTAAQGPSLASW